MEGVLARMQQVLHEADRRMQRGLNLFCDSGVVMRVVLEDTSELHIARHIRIRVILRLVLVRSLEMASKAVDVVVPFRVPLGGRRQSTVIVVSADCVGGHQLRDTTKRESSCRSGD